MADADNNNNPPANGQTGGAGANTGVDIGAQLALLGETLKAMNERMDVIQAQRTTVPEPKVEPANLYDPDQLLAEVNKRVEQQVSQRVRADREKDTVIYNLTQDFPEIQSDPKVRASIMEAQKELRPEIRDTAQGYELAVLKATAKHGLVRKANRPVVDDDVSLAPRGAGNANRGGKKAKLSPEQMAAAEMMGINLNDPERVKRLEEANQREDWLRYR